MEPRGPPQRVSRMLKKDKDPLSRPLLPHMLAGLLAELGSFLLSLSCSADPDPLMSPQLLPVSCDSPVASQRLAGPARLSVYLLSLVDECEDFDIAKTSQVNQWTCTSYSSARTGRNSEGLSDESITDQRTTLRRSGACMVDLM